MNKFITIFYLLFSFSLSAQSIKVKGTIKDSIGNPLEFANVIASIKSSGATESYGITNYQGRYQLDLPKGNTYILRTSFLGYETKEQTVNVTANSENIDLDFILNPQENQLDDVEIVYEMPVTVKGDTIVYNADSFTNGDERKLGDVMKKLPGVEVNDEGEIQVEGKTVSKVMVEGKDFFDGDSKLATKNIPADAVDKVEVLRNYNEVDQMRGLGNDRDNVAINIKLKEGKKNFWFGEVTAGAGIADEYGDDNGRYLVHPKLFYYSPKYSINVITDFNNIGEVPFTFRDYFNFTGGFKNFNKGGGTSFRISDSDLGFAVSQNDRAKSIDAKFVAGNFSYAVNDKLDISGFGILSDNKTNIVNNSIRQFIEEGITENTSTNNDQRNQLAMLKLSSTYKPNTNFQLDYDALIKTSKQTEDDATISIVGGNENDIEEVKENKPFSINQTANAYYTLNDKNIFAAEVQHLYQNEDPFYQAVQDSIPFRGVFTQINPLDPFNSDADTFDPLEQADRYNVNQNKTVNSNKLDAKVDYYYVLNNVCNLNFTVGTTYSHQKFNSSIFQVLDNANQNDFTDNDFNNDVTYTFTDAFFGLHYKLKSGKFIFNPGVTLHNYNLKNEQLGATSTQNDWRVLPDVNVVLELKKSENLRFNYAITSEYSDVNNYAEAYVFNNYNRLFRGNRGLENSLSHSYNLTYFSFNLFNYTNIGGNLSYTRRIDAIKTDTDLVGISQVSRAINFDSNFPDETFSAVGRFSKTIKKVQFKLDAAVFLSKTNNIINREIRASESFTQNYNASVLSNFKSFPNFEVGYRFMKNDYDNGGSTQIFFTNRPYANVNIRFLKNFNLFAEWDYYNYTNQAKTIENSYSFFNANLYYQNGESPWEFSVQATNILDTESINNDSFNDQFNTTSQYFVMPRIVMFVIKYDL
ncbi:MULTISPECIES: TonB-dependent receptor [Aequorivita]|uniref:Carboxypeptidase-like regulatory domain-containing protein n=1 Tax=Aequorivita iocasae TaxID=2803865 RepID=A0ABX7DNE3_9FLAO|nr:MULTISPECIES: TonB-dependent receptor [Aequorivita]QQX75310.1 carboxypeptidase-like regulatory domain-containing protein [Aequorivita iocasae]UCA54759.1 carboxypeptidase-like regulatory domain-containing protein [Aequorivita sp. F7]